MNKKLIITAVSVLVIASAVLFVFAGNIAIYTLGRIHNIDISYQSMHWDLSGNFTFKNLRLYDKAKDAGFGSKDAHVKILCGADMLHPAFDIDLKDVSFVRENKIPAAYDSINGLVMTAFAGDRTYMELKGVVEPSGSGITLKKLTGKGGEVSIMLDGTIDRSNNLNLDCTIYFSPEIIRKVPKELSSVIFKEGKDGWSDMLVHIEGNMDAPAINVSSKLFKLTIRGVNK